MTSPKLLRLPVVVAAERAPIAADRVLHGEPVQDTWLEHADESRGFYVGRWRCTPGKWRIAYTEQEYCQLLSGVSVLTDEAGQATTLRAGDAFVVPAGFRGTWEVVETTTKRFVIHDPP